MHSTVDTRECERRESLHSQNFFEGARDNAEEDTVSGHLEPSFPAPMPLLLVLANHLYFHLVPLLSTPSSLHWFVHGPLMCRKSCGMEHLKMRLLDKRPFTNLCILKSNIIRISMCCMRQVTPHWMCKQT
jgi:hypothetical protein